MRGELPKGIEIEEGGKKTIPERFSSYSEVQELCGAMIDADRSVRGPRRARVDGLVNGNRPIPQEVLNRKNFGWLGNVNYLEAEGYLQASQTPLFDLVTEVDHIVELTLDSSEVKGSKDEISDWADKIQRHFTWLMQVRWRKAFNYHIGMQQLQMLKHGLGAHIWPTKSWIPRTPRAGYILFPGNASINFDEDGEYYMVRDPLPPHSLHGFIRDEKVAKTLGWKTDAVWQALANASKDDNNRKKTSVEEIQRKIRRGDIGWTQANQAVIWVNHLFVRELETGKISQYIVTEQPDSNVKDYLFKRRNVSDEWDISLFPYDIGDGDLNSIRGLGERTASFFELSNRLKNAMASQVLISMFPMVKKMRDDIDPDKLRLLTLGAMRIIPDGLDIQQYQFPQLDNGPLALTRELRQTMENNNQSTIGSGVPEPKDRETAFSYSMRSHDQARVSNGLQSLYESNLQHFYDKMLRKVLDSGKGDSPYQKLSEEFKDRCRKDGVPDDALKSRAVAEVREVTSSGSGSAAARLQGLMTLMQYVFPNTSQDRQINIVRDITANAMGGAKVDRYAPSLTDNDLPTSDDSMAMVESSELSMGGDALMNGKQNHIKHGDNHLTKAEQIVQAVQQGAMEPERALTALQKLLNHAGEHLDQLQRNPMQKAAFEQLSQRWEEVAKFADQLKSEVEAKANEQPPEQQLSEDGKIKMAHVQLDAQVKDKKADADIARRFRKDAFSERLTDATTAASINRGRQKSNGSKSAIAA